MRIRSASEVIEGLNRRRNELDQVYSRLCNNQNDVRARNMLEHWRINLELEIGELETELKLSQLFERVRMLEVQLGVMQNEPIENKKVRGGV